MNQIDVTAGNGAGRFETVRQDNGVRPAGRITPQPAAPARPVQMNSDGGPAKTPPGAPTPPERPGLAPADIAALRVALTSGPDGFARKRDLGELHRQTVKLFQTLNEGLGEQQQRKAAEDRSVLITRMDRLEKSVNAMEGAVRIEMAPLMRGMLDEALAGQAVRQGRRSNRSLWLGLGLVAGLVAGVMFAGDIAPLADSLAKAALQIVTGMFGS